MSTDDVKEHVSDEQKAVREPCSAWPPLGTCGRCHGTGGWYSHLGPDDWDWSTCWDCGGTGNVKPATTRDPDNEPVSGSDRDR